jgi:adenylate cyclase
LATHFEWQELDRVRVKGKAKAITIYTPLAGVGELTSEQTEELLLWHSFLLFYRAQDWLQCDVLMSQLRLTDVEKPLYLLYIQRIARMREQPIDPDWDGATNFETK